MNLNTISKICVALAAVFLVAFYVFKIPLSNLLSFGVLLLCPLMHLVMMGGMDHGEKKAGSGKTKSCH